MPGRLADGRKNQCHLKGGNVGRFSNPRRAAVRSLQTLIKCLILTAAIAFTPVSHSSCSAGEQRSGQTHLSAGATVQVTRFSSPAGDDELGWLRNKVETNIAMFLSELGARILAGNITNPSRRPIDAIISGVIELSEGSHSRARDITITVECSVDGVWRAKSTVDGALSDFKQVYQSLPAALINSMQPSSPGCLQAEISSRFSRSPLAYAFWLEAHRRAKSNEKDLALTFLLRAVEIDPDFSAALFNISELRSQNRDVNTADIAIERAKSINPDHPKRSIVYQAVDPLPAVRTEMLNSKWQTIGDGLWLKEIRSRLYNLEMVSVKADAGIYGLGVTIADQPMGSTAKALREKTGSVAALPGGFFERDPNNNLSPSGLVIVDKAVIKQVTQGAGTGVLAISEDMTSIADARSSSLSSLTFGLQSGPILVETGGRMGVYRNDRVRLERAAICVNKDILILVFVGGSGLSLYDLSELLVSPEGSGGLGCDSALNLDGGPSAQLSLGSDGRIVEKPGFWRINNALLLKRKDN